MAWRSVKPTGSREMLWKASQRIAETIFCDRRTMYTEIRKLSPAETA